MNGDCSPLKGRRGGGMSISIKWRVYIVDMRVVRLIYNSFRLYKTLFLVPC